MMKITITMDIAEDKLNTLLAVLSGGQSDEKDVAPQSEDLPWPEPDSKHEPKEKQITKTDIRAVAAKLSRAGKQDVLAAVFAKFGCKKLSDFDGRTEDYPALMKELVAANG